MLATSRARPRGTLTMAGSQRGRGGRPARARSEGFGSGYACGCRYQLRAIPSLVEAAAVLARASGSPEAGARKHGQRAGIQMPPLLLGAHLRVKSPLTAIQAAHGAEQAARHAFSHPRFSCRGLEDAGEGLGQGEHGVPGDRVPMFS